MWTGKSSVHETCDMTGLARLRILATEDLLRFLRIRCKLSNDRVHHSTLSQSSFAELLFLARTLKLAGADGLDFVVCESG